MKTDTRNRCARCGEHESKYPNKYMMVLMYDVVAAMTKSGGFNLDPVDTARLTVDLAYCLMHKNRQRVKNEGKWYYAKLVNTIGSDDRADLSDVGEAFDWSDLPGGVLGADGYPDLEEEVCGAL